MPISNFPGGFNQGLNVRGVNVLNSYAAENVFWLSSVIGSDGNPGTFAKPFATLDYAIGRCTASKQDQINVYPYHAENMSSSSGGSVALDVIGVQVIGHGQGEARPTFTWTDAADSIDVTVAGIGLYNLIFESAVAGVANMVDVSGVAGFTMDNCYFRDTSTTLDTLEMLGFAASVSEVEITNSMFYARSGDINQMIDFAGVVRDVHIGHCRFMADVVKGGLTGDVVFGGVATGVWIHDCSFYNQEATSNNACINGTAETTHSGIVERINVSCQDTTPVTGDLLVEMAGCGLFDIWVTGGDDVQGYQVPIVEAAS